MVVVNVPLPKPYSNIYPEDDVEGCHYICYSPAVQPGGGIPNHQPVFTANQMHEHAARVLATAQTEQNIAPPGFSHSSLSDNQVLMVFTSSENATAWQEKFSL